MQKGRINQRTNSRLQDCASTFGLSGNEVEGVGARGWVVC